MSNKKIIWVWVADVYDDTFGGSYGMKSRQYFNTREEALKDAMNEFDFSKSIFPDDSTNADVRYVDGARVQILSFEQT